MGATTRAWTRTEVANRLIEAARTSHRLPPVRVQGYFNVWPVIVRTPHAHTVGDHTALARLPPTPAEIDRMLATMQWVQCLDVALRKLVWMRAKRWRWHDIGQHCGIAPRTAQRHWAIAIQAMVDHLSSQG